MSIPTRTPEGHSGKCPVCQHRVVIECSEPTGDAPCPTCGTLLWFAALDRDVWLCRERWIRSDVKNLIARSIAKLPPNSADSLDFVEVIMEVEDFFDISVSDAEAETIRTVQDFIDFLRRHADGPDR